MDKILFYSELSNIDILNSYISTLEDLEIDELNINIKNDGLYFLEPNVVFYSSSFDKYISNENIKIIINVKELLKSLNNIEKDFNLYMFIKNDDLNSLRIIQRKNELTVRDNIKIKIYVL